MSAADQIEGAPGTVSQVRGCAFELIRYAKENGVALVLVGHVTKDGSIAGPRVLEHIVDTVLYFEGERYSTYRILRGTKNRFGSTNEIGLFEMMSNGLNEVPNPSEIFLSERPEDTTEEITAIRHALAKHQGHRGKAAAELAMDRTTLWRRMRRFGLQ